MTGGRVKRLEPLLKDAPFMLTYGDGVSDVNPADVLRLHREHGKLATITAVRPPARFGGLQLAGAQVTAFTEKPQIGEGWINGGYMVCSREIFKYLPDDPGIMLEQDPMRKLTAEGQLAAFRHEGFWQPMDTFQEFTLLNSMWEKDKAPWKVWT